MRFFETLTVACLLATNTPVFAHPQSVAEIESSSATERREAAREAERIFAPVSDLWKRKGGGGGGGKGSGGGSSSGSSGKGGSSGSSGSGSTGYVPAFIQDDGHDRSKEDRERRVDGVGSSTSALASRRHHHAEAGLAVEDTSKSAAGGVKDTSLRIRRFVATIAAGRSSFSAGSSGNSAKMGPSSGHRLPKSGSNKNDKNNEANKDRSGSTGRGSAGSNAGGQTRTGSGVAPSFGGKYGGGAKTPYTAGRASPLGIAPVFLGVGLLAVYPGLWLYGAYGYGYHNPYSFRNRTARRNTTDTNTINTPTRDLVELIIRQEDQGVNETKPITCLCAEYSVCGCDDDGNYTFLDTLIGDGDYFKLNHSLITVADVNGTSTILLNGTLPNGTTAPGGTEDAITSNSSDSTNGAAVRTLIEAGGYWVMIATVAATCFVI